MQMRIAGLVYATSSSTYLDEQVIDIKGFIRKEVKKKSKKAARNEKRTAFDFLNQDEPQNHREDNGDQSLQ